MTLAGGFKEDFITVPIISWIVLALYSIWTLLLLILVIVRRNHQPVKARSPLLMILSLITMCFFVVFNALRFGIGRSLFPCILYTMSFSLLQPGVFLPTVLRAWRLFFVYRVSTLKQVVAAQHLRRRDSVTSDISVESADISESVNASTIANAASEASMDMQDAMQQEDGQKLEKVENSYLTTVAMEDMAVEEKKEAIIAVEERAAEGTNSQNADTIGTNENNQYHFQRKSKRAEKMMRSLTIWVSTPFLVGVLIVFLMIHGLIWVGGNFIDAETYFDFTQGCKFGGGQMIIAVVLVLVYLVMEFVMGALLLTVKDTWFMRYGISNCSYEFKNSGTISHCTLYYPTPRFEIYINILQWFITMAVFSACELIASINIVDYYVPFGYLIVFACFVDSVISCFVPIVASFILQRRSDSFRAQMLDSETGNLQHDELRFVLQSKRLRAMFKQFTVQSFAPESLLCWEFIQRYKTTKNGQKRFRFGKELIVNFMMPSGDFELNLPAVISPEEYMSKLMNKSSEPPVDFFAPLQRHCEMDLIDMFFRFKSRKDYQRVKMKEEQEMQMEKQIGLD